MYKLLFPLLAVLASSQATSALRPKDVSICDYYTPIVTGKKNSAKSQYELMLLITHTFVVGNYTRPNVGISVTGAAAISTFEGHPVNLLPFFDGGYASTNDGGPHGVVKNFLDSGGATALLANKPADSKSSNQYNLFTHVYQYFGEFYQCSHQGNDEFPLYQGVASMFEVHKFMDADKYLAGYFNQQITLAVASLGFEQPDVDFTRSALDKVFTNRCSPAATVIPASAGPRLQSICAAGDCPLDPNADCAAYPNDGLLTQPRISNATLVGNVTQQNETTAATTAAWPAHCVAARDGTGQEGCPSQTSAAAIATASGAADATGAGHVSIGWAITASLAGMLYFA